jgi:hypothetical protein
VDGKGGKGGKVSKRIVSGEGGGMWRGGGIPCSPDLYANFLRCFSRTFQKFCRILKREKRKLNCRPGCHQQAFIFLFAIFITFFFKHIRREKSLCKGCSISHDLRITNKSCSRCLLPQSTYIPREQCLSSRPNWDPRPLSRKRVCPPRNKGGGGGWGIQFGRLEKKPIALCLLCAYYQTVPFPASLLQTEKLCYLLPKSTLVTLFHLLLHIKNPLFLQSYFPDLVARAGEEISVLTKNRTRTITEVRK